MKKIYIILMLILMPIGLLAVDTSYTNIEADYLKYNYKKGFTLFYGNVRLTQPYVELRADTIVEYEKDKRVEAFGKIYYNNIKDSIVATGSKAIYLEDTQYLELTGNPVIKSLKDTFSICADTVIVLGNARRAFFYNNVKIRKEEIAGSCNYAEYIDTGRVFTMTDSAVVTKGEDVFRSDTIVLYIDSKEVEMLGHVKGRIYREENGRVKTK